MEVVSAVRLDQVHSRGLFGVVNGVEIPFVTEGRSGAFGVPVHYFVAQQEFVDLRYPELDGTTPPGDGFVRVPVDAVEDAARWLWKVAFEGAEYVVDDVRNGRFLIGTSDSRIASMSDEWEGDFYSGWARWIDPTGLDVTAEKHLISPADD